MTFNVQSWGRISNSANNAITLTQAGTFVGAPSVYTYISATDTLATIAGANYFAPVVAEVNQGDFIYAVDSGYNTEIYTITAVNVAAKTITVVTAGGVVPAFPLSMALGGTGANLAPVAGGAVYSGAASMAITAAPSATGQILSGTVGGAAPVFTTATYPRTTTINQILYSSAANTVTGLATLASSVLVTSAGGVPSLSTTLPTNLAMQTPASINLTNATNVPAGQISGVIPLANGGTNANLAAAASNGGIVWSNATQLQILAGTATANQVLLSGSSVTPAWSTATYPATTTINQLLYSSAANTIGGLATANSSVLVTSAGGVPSLSTTLPNGLAMGTPASLVLTNATGLPIAGITGLGTGVATALAANVNGSGAISLTTSPTFVTPTLGVATATSLQLGANGLLDTNGNEMQQFSATATAVNQWKIINAATTGKPILQAVGSDTNVIGQLQGQGTGHVEIQGTTTNDSATAGYVGELIAANVLAGSAISISNNTPANVTSISLTAGDWDVTGNVTVTGSSGVLTNVTVWGSSTSATLPDASTSCSLTSTVFTQFGAAIPRFRFRSVSTTTVYLSVQASFATGTATACGTIYARRVR
jgi:hypothetical protein